MFIWRFILLIHIMMYCLYFIYVVDIETTEKVIIQTEEIRDRINLDR